MNLRSTAMLTSLSIGLLAARKFDKKETAALAQRHGAVEKALHLNKTLFSTSEHYQAITAVRSRARAYINDHTNPWDGEGWRIMRSSEFMEMSAEIRKFELEFDHAVKPFLVEYQSGRLRDKAVLNGLWREEDYPPVEKAKKKFYFELEFQPLPDVSDWRVDVGREEMEVLRRQAEKSVQDRINKSMVEPHYRLFDGVAHMASRITGAKTCPCRGCKNRMFLSDSVSDSLVDNLRKICDILPKLNITDDPNLAALIEEAKAGLLSFNVGTIRENPTVRNTLAERAAKLQSELGWVLNAA